MIRKNVLPVIAALVVAVLVIIGVGKLFSGGGSNIKVTAHFTQTVGLYKGSTVRVLGVPVGKVTKLTPQGTTVQVTMSVKKSVKIPADAKAYIIPPSLVSDRYVQLAPVFTSGEVMADGADIPLARTRTPVELDTIIADLDKLFKGLGPTGVNKDGALSRAISTGARVLKGTGGDINTTLTQLSSAVQTLANGKDDLVGIVHNLATFSQTLASSDTTVRAFATDLAGASQQLSDQRKDLGLALKNLAVALDQVGSLVRDHRGTLTADVKTLKLVTDKVVARQRQLKEFLDVFPTAVTSIGETIDLRTPTSISLPIRANNQQTDDPAPIILCQVLAPILGIDCNGLPVGNTPSKLGVAGPPLDLSTSTAKAKTVSYGPDLSLRGMLGVTSVY